MVLFLKVRPNVQLAEPIRATKAIKQTRDQLIENGASKKGMSTSFVSIIKLRTRIAAVYKATVFAVHKVTFLLMHKVTLSAIHIEPKRPTTCILRAHQVYKAS